MPLFFTSVPNRIALGVTALAVVVVFAWSSRPMTGSWQYAAGDGGRPSLRHPIAFQGFGGPEPWGRWTVDDRASISFGRPFPRQFTAIVMARASGPNAGAPIRVCAGKACVVGTWTEEWSAARLSFGDHDGARRLRFEIPHPMAPGGGDERRLGLGLASVAIEEVGR